MLRLTLKGRWATQTPLSVTGRGGAKSGGIGLGARIGSRAMSDVGAWVPVGRDDTETVGYLDPVTEDYDVVQPRTVLGHALGAPVDFLEGEAALQEHGIGELAESWILDAGTDAEVADLTIVELSPRGIHLADRLSSKALNAPGTLRIDWPDVDARLRRV